MTRFTRRRALAVAGAVGVAGVVGVGGTACPRRGGDGDGGGGDGAGVDVDDASRLNPVHVRRVERPQSVDDVVAAVKRARADGLALVAGGARHSQGGHAAVKDGVVVDTRALSGVTQVDVDGKYAVINAGTSWDDVQRALNPRGLAVKTMQSSNIFTVGGSLSSNIHGRDVNDGVILKTIRRLKIVDATGAVVDVDRTHPLFPCVIGGYGLFGVVVEVELDLAPNALMAHEARVIPATDVAADFAKRIAGTDALFIARPSIAPSSFMDETIVETWTATNEPIAPALLTLGEEQNVQRDKLVFDASRASGAGKEARWALQRQAALAAPARVTRNNAMRPPTTPLAFLMHNADADTDIVQEYFIPVAQYGAFLSSSREILKRRAVNVLGVTIRFVKGDDTAMLSFAPTDAFAFMIYTNQLRSDDGRANAAAMTKDLVDAALATGGKHYLTYQTWPTREQVRAAYPRFDAWLAKKQAADPQGAFKSAWLAAYA